MNVAASSLLSKGYADERRALISVNRALPVAAHGMPPAHHDTVYVSAVDGNGNACSLINSLFMSFGSGLVVPGAGIALHNRGASFSLEPSHANRLEPRKLPFHTLIPGMATRDGELFASYGVMGAMQQAQGHLQALTNMIDFRADPAAGARRATIQRPSWRGNRDRELGWRGHNPRTRRARSPSPGV